MQETSHLNTQNIPSRAMRWGTVLVVLGILLFAFSTISVVSETLLATLDRPVLQYFGTAQQRLSPALIELVKLLGQLGSDGTSLFAVGLLGFSLYRRNKRQFWLLASSIGGGEAVWLLLVFAFNRPRPVPVTALGGLDLPSYPSGHTMLVLTVFLALLYLHYTGLKSQGWRLFFAAMVIIWATLTGVIRLFLSVHYLTDVIGGYALGLAWTGISILLVDVLFHHKIIGKTARE